MMGEAEPVADAEFLKLAKLLDGAGSPLACLRCGTKPLALVDDPSRGLRSGLPLWSYGLNALARLVDRSPDKRLDVLTLLCPNCGHVEQFSEEVLRRKAEGPR
jgi:hypothetical protein